MVASNPGASGGGDAGGRRPHVVVVGAGFGGLRVARALRHAPVDVTLIDRHNYHTFLPLRYEVASAGLEPGEIAQPVRAILRGIRDIRFRMAAVQHIDLAGRAAILDAGSVYFDYLVIAAGSATNFFGLRSVEEGALGLKDLREATAVRNHILRSFEHATLSEDPEEVDRLMTMVVIGGGPTGVELAGALAELKHHVLPRDSPELDFSKARVILLGAMDHLLAAMPHGLQRNAHKQLGQLGVEVRFGAAVSGVTPAGVVLSSGETISAASVIWVAGVRGEALAETLPVDLGPGKRVRVLPTLQVPGHPEVYVIGDLAFLQAADGRPYPMLAQVAMQQGELAATNILREISGRSPEVFRYRDRGTMATIGRKAAVAHVFGLQFSGLVAWALWLAVHLIALIGLRNRALVLVNWTWNYFHYDRANRLITNDAATPSTTGSPWPRRESRRSPQDKA